MRHRQPRGGTAALRLTRYLGAAALLAVGLDHLDQYAAGHYDAIPTIGTLFALNFASATLIAGGLAAPPLRFGRRSGRPVHDALAVGGIAVAAGSLVALLLSERTPVFGFMETGYRAGIVLSLGLDAATIALLAAFLALPGSPPSTIVGRTWPRTSSHPRSTRPRRRSWTPSGRAARPRSGR